MPEEAFFRHQSDPETEGRYAMASCATTIKIPKWIYGVNLAYIPFSGIYLLATTKINLYPQLIHCLVKNAYVMAENL